MANENTELDVLKGRADLLGVNYTSKVTADTLRELIRQHNEKLEDVVISSGSSPNLASLARKEVVDEAMKLIRVRITNMNSKKKDLKGEIITVENEFIGTVSKFIPFDPEYYVNGYHVPNCIYENLKERRFISIRVVKDRATGSTRVTENWVLEYSIEVLPQLTEKELNELSKVQQASGSIDLVNAV